MSKTYKLSPTQNIIVDKILEIVDADDIVQMEKLELIIGNVDMYENLSATKWIKLENYFKIY